MWAQALCLRSSDATHRQDACATKLKGTRLNAARFKLWLLAIALLQCAGFALAADAPATKPAGPDVSEFKTTATARTTRLTSARSVEPTSRGYLGIDVELVKSKPM